MKDRWPWVRKAWDTVGSWLGRHWGVLTLALVALVIVIGLTMWFWPAPWDWMKRAWNWMKGTGASNGAVLRNLALVAAALIGLPLAAWRSWVAHKQADTAERGHNNERYQKGADMLGSNVMTTRMGGVYALERLAQEHPHEYHVQIMKLLCAFLRHQAKDGGEEAKAESKKLWLDLDATAHDPPGDGGILARKKLRLDLDAAAQAIGECRRRLAKMGRLKHIECGFRLNLLDVNLSGANLRDANLSGANLSGANLFRADLRGANLSHARLYRANLTGTVFWDANLTGTVFWEANLSDATLSDATLSDAFLLGANLFRANLRDADLSRADLSDVNFHQVKYLSQVQLDIACQDPDGSPPMHLPDGLIWDEEAAKKRWRETY